MAIQVSGTEVISNSRALNNIASVDATTAAAFGAAGVGGATTLLVNSTLTSTSTTITIDFTGGYKKYEISLERMDPAGYVTGPPFQCRLTNSSGTVISSNDYSYTNNDNKAKDENGLYFTHLSNNELVQSNLHLTINSPYDSDTYTTMYGMVSTNRGTFSNDYYQGVAGITGMIKLTGRNNSLIVTNNLGGSSPGWDGGKIKVWGIN